MPKFLTRKGEGRPEGRVPDRGGMGGGETRKQLKIPKRKPPELGECPVCGKEYPLDGIFCPKDHVPLIR